MSSLSVVSLGTVVAGAVHRWLSPTVEQVVEQVVIQGILTGFVA
jgi:hypothetical protein